jgi:hypothetical protein
VAKKHSYFDKKKIMYGAFSVSKGKKGYSLAFVGTINAQCSKVFNTCQINIPDKENISKAIF